MVEVAGLLGACLSQAAYQRVGTGKRGIQLPGGVAREHPGLAVEHTDRLRNCVENAPRESLGLDQLRSRSCCTVTS